MNILLAGGAGYIGSHTAVELLTAGHDVVIVDNYCNSCAEAVNRVEEVSGKKVVSYEADVKDKVAMAKIDATENMEQLNELMTKISKGVNLTAEQKEALYAVASEQEDKFMSDLTK